MDKCKNNSEVRLEEKQIGINEIHLNTNSNPKVMGLIPMECVNWYIL